MSSRWASATTYAAPVSQREASIIETVAHSVGQYLYLTAKHMDESWLREYTTRMGQPTPPQIHQAMGKLNPRMMTLVAVGNRDLVPTLSKYGQVWVVQATDFLKTGLQTAEVAE